jgi:hypothetical protein
MRTARLLLGVACTCLGAAGGLQAQGASFHVLGGGGVRWSQAADFQLMTDDTSAAPALQPVRFAPDANIVPLLGPWWDYREPYDPTYREGHPRAWLGVNASAYSSYYVQQTPTKRWVDGDPTTYTELWDEPPHFYTVDLGAPVYADRLVFYPPRDGVSVNTGDPFYPKYVLQKYELYGAVSEDGGQLLAEKLKGASYDPATDWVGSGMCCPLEVLLGREDSHTDPVTIVDFQLQRLQFFRLLLLANSLRTDGTPVIDFWANAEIEVYGRGFAPDCLWESRVIDVGQGQAVILGRAYYDVSHWRLDPETGAVTQVDPGSSTVSLQLQTGTDEDPVIHYVYNDLGGLSEAPRDEWMSLDSADMLGGTEGPGFRGPRADDRDNWSFWSSPLPASGAVARLPVGRYARLRLRLRSDSPWDFARVDRVRLERGPLLAERIVGEVAGGRHQGAGDGQGGVPLLAAGAREPVVLAMRADFGGTAQLGFDGLRITTALEVQLDSLAVGPTDAQLERVEPDSVVAATGGLAVYLPRARRIRNGADRYLQLHLSARLFGAASGLTVEVFDRAGEHLAQQVADGDATASIGSDRLLLMAAEGSGQSIIGALTVTPRAITPQGDGINDTATIDYTVFRVLDQASVQVTVHRLDGRQVWRARTVSAGAGGGQVAWDGRDSDGALVAPGIYLVRVEVAAEAGRAARVQPVAVAY